MSASSKSSARAWPVAAADIAGLARLGFDASLGIVDLVEQMHGTISDVAPPVGRARAGRTRGITGLVYRSVRGVTRATAGGASLLAGALQPLVPPAPLSPPREAVLAAINGIWGDHLQATGNPLAIRMTVRKQGVPVALEAAALRAAWPQAGSRLAVLVHGLCMNDLQWERNGHHHGRMLEAELGYTALSLHYNTGLHVSGNGAQLAELLEQLLAEWPVPVTELVLVGHSMGGLVARSACHCADVQQMQWPRTLRTLVCLGSPHQGAVMERGGHLIDSALGLSPYSAPFARLARARSAGIQDLRFGNVQQGDWEGVRRTAMPRDTRLPTPLPSDVNVFLLAATTAASLGGLRHAVLGDGLVSLRSAWGEHRSRAHALAVPASRREVILQANHWDLLSHPMAADALRRWLAPQGAAIHSGL